MSNQGEYYCAAFVLKPAGPYRLDLTVWALRRRANNKIDTWQDGLYRRILIIDGKPVLACVRQMGEVKEAALKCEIFSQEGITSAIIKKAKAELTWILGLDIDLSGFYSMAKQDKVLGALVKPYVGFKPPRFADMFEAAVNGICYQQLSLAVGTVLLNRLAVAAGHDMQVQEHEVYSCGDSAGVCGQSLEKLRGMGFSTNKAIALLELCEGVNAGRIDLEQLKEIDDDAAVKILLKMRGLGKWTAEYMLLRGLGRLHIYPGDDIGFQNGLKKWLGLNKLDKPKITALMNNWHGFGGMIYFHMLLRRLTIENLIEIH